MIRDGKILLLLRSGTGYMDGQYCLPSGHKDEHETAGFGACRETKEEVGIAVDPRTAECVHVMLRKDGDERVSFFFVTTEWQGEAVNCEPDKHSEVGWFPLDQLPDNMVWWQRRGLEGYLGKEPFSTVGWE